MKLWNFFFTKVVPFFILAELQLVSPKGFLIFLLYFGFVSKLTSQKSNKDVYKAKTDRMCLLVVLKQGSCREGLLL